MKIILSESKLESAIESALKREFEIVSVKFKDVQVVLGSTEGQPTITQRRITVIADPLRAAKGDLTALRENIPYYYRGNIIKYLVEWFGLDFMTYGSKWDIEVYFLRLSKN